MQEAFLQRKYENRLPAHGRAVDLCYKGLSPINFSGKSTNSTDCGLHEDVTIVSAKKEDQGTLQWLN